jgi:Chaperone of endosialidase
MFVDGSQLVVGASTTNFTATPVVHPGTDQNFNVGAKVNLADGVSFTSGNDANTLLKSIEFLGTSLSFNGTSAFFPGIGTTASAANAFLNSGSSPANQLLRSTSSRRYKKDIQRLDRKTTAQKIMEMEPVKFHSIASADGPKRWYIGLVAEDMAKIDDGLVNDIPDKDGRLIPDGVQYDRVSVLLLTMVKEQAKSLRS